MRLKPDICARRNLRGAVLSLANLLTQTMKYLVFGLRMTSMVTSWQTPDVCLTNVTEV
jgi:hypothetical protein